MCCRRRRHEDIKNIFRDIGQACIAEISGRHGLLLFYNALHREAVEANVQSAAIFLLLSQAVPTLSGQIDYLIVNLL